MGTFSPTRKSPPELENCAPNAINAKVYEVSSASLKTLDVHTFQCDLSILIPWQAI